MRINRLFLFVLFAFFAACGGGDDEVLIGDWEYKGNFGGEDSRQQAVSFVINNKVYVGLGYNSRAYALKDFYVYDGKGGWGANLDFPGEARNGATAFVIGNKAYVGLGYNSRKDNTYYKDFYEYNSETNTWREVAPFPAEARDRRDAAGGAIGGKGYIIGGYDGTNSFMDVYEYTPDTNGPGVWEKNSKQQYQGNKRRGASTFVLGGKLYMFGGSNSGSLVFDFQVFDPSVGEWKALNLIRNAIENKSFDDEYGSLAREYACVFTINGKAYVSLGQSGSGVNNSSTFEYDPAVDRWYKKTVFEGTSRVHGNGFSITVDGVEKGFITCGVSVNDYPDDLWEFHPDIDENEYNNF